MAKSTNSKENELFGGIKAGNIEEISSKFICELCRLILFYPWQLLCCGALVCRWCLSNGLSNSEPFICPLCHTKQSKKEASPDRGAERELKTIMIVCYACTWNGSYNDYLEHLQKRHADLECIDCHKHFFAINSFEEHRQQLCIHRSISCGLPDCTNAIKWYDMKAHYLTIKHQLKLHLIISQYVHSKRRQVQTQNHFQEYQDLHESIDMAFSAYEILLNDPIRLKVEIIQIKMNSEQNVSRIEELKKQGKENENGVKILIEKQSGLQTEVDNIKKIGEESEILVLDGSSTTTLRFNLPNTSTFSMNSLKFRTSQYGYPFILRVCSTVEHKEAYLSLFLSLYNGEYSNLIPYPFPYDIHLVLWDQSNQQKHIFHVLKPDRNSSALARPICEKNDEYGIIKFCSLRYLMDSQSIYVRDGVFYIRVFVDFLNTGQNPFQVKDNNQDTEIMSTTRMITD